MKFTIVAVATFAASVAAQLSIIPACAQTCLLTGLTATTCGSSIACACKDQAFLTSSVACIKKSCPLQSDQDLAKKGAIGLCAENGVTITIPDDSTPSSTSAPAPTAAPTAAPTTAAPAPSSATSEAPAPTTSAKSPCKPGYKPRRHAM